MATSRIACLVLFLATIGRQVSPLYTPEDFLYSRVGTLPAINNPRTAALMVQPGHRDQLPSNYDVADEWNLRGNSSMISRARVHARARKGASVGVRCNSSPSNGWVAVVPFFARRKCSVAVSNSTSDHCSSQSSSPLRRHDAESRKSQRHQSRKDYDCNAHYHLPFTTLL